MNPAEVAVDFYRSAFPAFARHFFVRTLGQSELAPSLDVLVSPDGTEVWAATVGEHRRIYTRLEMTGRRLTHLWWKSFIKASSGHESDALNLIATRTEELTARGWTRHLVEEGEIIEE